MRSTTSADVHTSASVDIQSCTYRTPPATPTSATPAATPAPSAACANDAAHAESCPGWVTAGECSANAEFMETNCRLSCGLCSTASTKLVRSSYTALPINECAGGTFLTLLDLLCLHGLIAACPDRSIQAVSHARDCRFVFGPDTVPSALLPTAVPTVGCFDAPAHAASCSGWATADECSTNAAFMAENCRLSCGLCTSMLAVPLPPHSALLWTHKNKIKNSLPYLCIKGSSLSKKYSRSLSQTIEKSTNIHRPTAVIRIDRH